jgi:hypothetical protein
MESKEEESCLSTELSAWVHGLVGSLWSYKMEIQSTQAIMIVA